MHLACTGSIRRRRNPISYVNRYTKDVVIVLSGFAGYIDLLLSENNKCVQPYTKRLKTAQTYCATIIDGILHDVDETQRNMLAKQAQHTTVLLVPDEQAKRTPELCVIDMNTVNQLINSAFGECFLCSCSIFWNLMTRK